MKVMTDPEALRKALDEDPSDSQTRLIYSDACEEVGKDDEAAAMRWLVENGKYYCDKEDASSEFCAWFYEDDDDKVQWECALPRGLWDCLKGFTNSGGLWKDYPSPRAADRAFVNAFRRWGKKLEAKKDRQAVQDVPGEAG